MDIQDKYEFSVEKQENNVISVKVKANADLFAEFKDKAFDKLAKTVKIAGFRPGKAPKAKIEAKIGNDIYSETIRQLLPEVAASIVESENFNPVTQLEYDIQKFTEAEGVEFSFSFANYPEVKLPKLESLSVEVDMSEEVTEKEITDVMQNLYQSEQRENKQQDLEEEESEKQEKEEKFDPSMITDEMVTKWDIDGAKTVDELKKAIEQKLKEVKHQQNHRKLEESVIEAVVEAAEFEIPDALLEQQSQQILNQYLARIEELDIDKDTFLAAQGLDMSKLEEQKKEEARKQISVDLVLNEVAKQADVIPTTEDIEAQIAGVQDEKTREQLDSFNGRRYILSTLLQANAIEHLEKVVKVKAPKKTEKKSTSKPKKK